MRRNYAIISIILVGVLVVPFLGVSVSAQETVNFAIMNDPFVDAMGPLVEEFEEETGINVVLDILPYSSLREQAITDFSTGMGEYDIYAMDIVWTGEWAEAGFITPIDEFIEDRDEINWGDLLPGAKEGLMLWEDQIVAMPLGSYHFATMYRKDWFEEKELEVPVTMEDYREVLPKLTEPEKGRYGISVPYVRGAPITHYSLAVVSGLGQSLLANPPHNYSPQIDAPISVAAFTLYKDFLDWGPPGMRDFDWHDNRAEFIQGNAAMATNWTSGLARVEAEDAESAGNTGYTYLPRLSRNNEPTVPFGGWSMVINDDSTQKEAAFEFMKWFVSEEVQKEYARLGGTPNTLSAISDPKLQERFPFYEWVEEVESNGYADPQVRPRYPFWPKMEEILGSRLSQIMVKDAPVRETLRQANLEIEEVIKEAEYPVE